MMRIDTEGSRGGKQFTSRQLKGIEYVFDSQTIRPVFFIEYLLSRERYIAVHAAGSPFDTHARSHSLTYIHAHLRAAVCHRNLANSK